MGKQRGVMFVIGVLGAAILLGVAGQGVASPLAVDASRATPVMNYLPYVSFQPDWQWQPGGLGDRTVRDLLGSETATYAGVEPGGVWRAGDCTLDWQSRGLADQSVFALAQTANGHLYAGTFGSGVFRSTNSGQTWQAASSGLGDPRVYGLATHAADPILLAAGFDRGLYRSTNGGGTWQRSAPNDLNELNAVLFDPGLPAVAYAGTYQRGIYKSTTTGASFAPASTGLPAQASVWVIAAVRASNATTITLGTNDGVYLSTDAGSHWRPAGLHGQEVRALAGDPSDAAHWFAGTRTAGVWETTDAGATWRDISRGLPAARAVYAVRVMPAPCSLLVAGTSDGVYRRPVWLRSDAE